jgi:hypothetical protein
VWEFLLQLFPCGKFIVNYRDDIWKQSKSGFLRQNTNAKSYLENYTAELLQFAKHDNKHTDQFYYIKTEDFSQLEVWNDMFAWLGHPECIVNYVLHMNAKGRYTNTAAFQDKQSHNKTTAVHCTVIEARHHTVGS